MGVVAGFCSIRTTKMTYEGLAGGQSGIGKGWRLPVCRFVDPPERRQADRRRTKTTRADRSARRPKSAKLAINEPLRRSVQDRLAGLVMAPNGAAVRGPVVPWKGRRHGRRQDRRWATAWSPEQIARRLRLDVPDDETMRISHEAIYQALYVQGRGALRRELTACLRTGRALRVP